MIHKRSIRFVSKLFMTAFVMLLMVQPATAAEIFLPLILTGSSGEADTNISRDETATGVTQSVKTPQENNDKEKANAEAIRKLDVIAHALSVDVPGQVGPQPVISPDEYESDDSVGQATEISVDGSPQTHNFHMEGDDDWLQFTAEVGTRYTIETLNIGTATDTFIYLYDTDGSTEISADDDSGSGLASRLQWVAPTSGTYYVRVRPYSGSINGSDTNYDVHIVTVEDVPSSPDAYEPDNIAVQATEISTDGTLQAHNFHVEGDEDWIKFTAAAGTLYTIETLNLGPTSDTYIYLYEPDRSTVIDANDDSRTSLASQIVWVAQSSETYYIRIRHYSVQASGSETNYDVQISENVQPPISSDGYEVDDAPSQATDTLTNGMPQLHNFHRDGDEDWIFFTAQADTDYAIDAVNLGPLNGLTMTLYDSDGATEIIYNDDFGTGQFPSILWYAQTGGTYYVRLNHMETLIDGVDTEYLVYITALENTSTTPDEYEVDNLATEATEISTDGASQTHNFHTFGDEDWIQFTTEAGELYDIETFNLGSESDTYIYLYDIDGVSEIRRDDDSGSGYASRIQWLAPTSDTYYVRIRHYSDSASGSNTNYDVRVTRGSSSADSPDTYEIDNLASQATVINTDGTPQTHDFHIFGDEDWLQFTTEAGMFYTVETFNLGPNSDTYIYLYDTDGSTEISRNDDFSGYASRIQWIAPTSDTYYVRIRHYSDLTSGSDTNYDVRITFSEDVPSLNPADEYEDDNQATQANEIRVGDADQLHNFHIAGDEDWLKFTTEAETPYIIVAFSMNPTNGTSISLYDTDSTSVLASSDDFDFISEGFSMIEWVAPTDGTYYIRIQPYNNAINGIDTRYQVALIQP